MITLSIFDMLVLVFLVIGTGVLLVLMNFHHMQIEEQRALKKTKSMRYDEYIEYS